MQSDINYLKNRSAEVNRAMDSQRAQLHEQISAANKSLRAVDDKLQELNRAARKDMSGVALDVEDVRRELQELRGQLELITYQQTRVRELLEGDHSLPVRFSALEKKLAKTLELPSPALAKTLPSDSKSMLLLGAKLTKEGKYSDARGIYREVLRRFSTETGVPDEARYRLGDLYLKERKLRPALTEFIAIVETFPRSVRVDDAYFKIAETSMALGNYEDAQIFFSEIIKNHKRSPLVKPAKKLLKELKKKLRKEKRKVEKESRKKK